MTAHRQSSPRLHPSSWVRQVGSPAGPEQPVAATATDHRPPPGLIGARYQLINQLARGGMGLVYRAIDRLTGRVVTVKRLCATPSPGSAGSAGLRTTLAREFRLLASLRHPNVITVLDYGFDEDREPFLTMDLEENARTIVEAGAEAPLAVQVDLLVQTLLALVYLHRLGIVHRDLKPENILVVRGQVKVLDFGLSFSRTAAPEDVGWGGTPAYMAPEILCGEPPSEQSDLYGLGLVAYELLTGTHPFEGLSAAKLYDAVTRTPLPRPEDPLDARLRPVLERLLAKAPGARYRDAREVISAFGSALGRQLAVETVATRESVLQTAPLVGRDGDLATLETALREAISGNGGTWLVGGESGVGKSRVLDELRARGLVEGAVVVRGQAISQGGSPYHPWRDVLTSLLLWVDVSDPDAEVLTTIVPNIGHLLGREIGAPPVVDSGAAQTRLLFAVEEVFRLQSRPVVVILEDLHWAGSESLKLLAWLVQTTERLRLLVVGSFRDDDAPELPETIPGARLLTLRRLEREEIATLGEAMVGPAARRADVLDLLERESEGIPFFVVEVVRTLAEISGALDRVGAAELPARVLSGGMEKVVRRRLARVPPGALAVLRTAAAVGRRIDPTLLRAVHPELDVDEWAGSCARTAVLELHDQHWMFAHDKLREQLVEDLPGAARRTVHRAIGEAMERLYAERPDHLAALAHHWREAGDFEREARYAREAGMVALQTGACREAVGFLLRARELLLVADADSASRRRRGPRGLLDPNALVDTAGPEFLLGLVESGLSEAFYRLGDLKTCREHSERALQHFGQHVPSSSAGWTAGVVWQGLLRGLQSATHVRSRDVERARRVASEVARVQLRLTDTFFYSLRLAPILWSSLRVVNQCAPAGPLPELAQGYVILGLLAGAGRAHRLAETWGRRALAIAEGTGIERNVAWIRTRRAVYHVGECRWTETEAGLRQATAVAERVGDLRLWEEARVQHALVGLYCGRFEESLSLFREAHRLSRRTGNRQIECWALMGEGAVTSRLGRDETTVRLVEAALEMIGEDVMKGEAIIAYGVLALARLRTGDWMGAYEAADRAVWHIRAMKPVAYWTLPGLAGAAEVILSLLEARWAPTPAVRADLPVRTRQAVVAMRRFARHFPLGRPNAGLWNGLAAWLAGRPRRAFRLWTRTLALAEQLGTPYERARAHLEIGRHLPLEAHDRRHHLSRADELFERLGCAADVARVREEMARSGTPAGSATACP